MHRPARHSRRLRNLAVLCALSLRLLAAACMPAQDDGAESSKPGASGGGADWIRLESAQTGRTPAEQTEVHVIYAQATSENRDAQLRALRRIRELVEENDPVSRFPEVTEIISLLVLEPYRVSRRGGAEADPAAVPHAAPAVRTEAIALLGRTGGDEAYRVLLELLRRERDPTVLAAALRTLARLEQRPGPELPGALAAVLGRSRGDPAPLRAGLAAIRSLHARYGFLDTPELFTAVIDVAQGPYQRSLRAEAFEVVELLRE